MTDLKLYFLLTVMISLSCNRTSHSKLNGVYSNEHQIILKLEANEKFILEIPKSPLDLETEVTKLTGTYKINSGVVVLTTENTNAKPYKIEVPPQSRTDGYEFMIKGEGWGGLSGVHCKIEQDGKIVQESITAERGLVKFDYLESGKLIIAHNGWESVAINLEEFTNKSLMITLERENYRENIPNYKFVINGKVLKGMNEIEHWELKMK